MFATLDHQVRALDSLRKAGVVFDCGRNHQLAAGRRLLLGISRRIDQQRIEVRAPGIDRSRQSRRAGPYDYDLTAKFLFAQGELISFSCYRTGSGSDGIGSSTNIIAALNP